MRMIDVIPWMSALLQKLRPAFGERLLFLGLQGSCRRGEATEHSDIDVVLVLDALEIQDLRAYRALLRTLPEGEKCCGFTGSAQTLYHWPRHELFAFQQDTDAYWGSLDALLPPIFREDIRSGVRTGASALYHAASHAYLFETPDSHADTLCGLFKGVFFTLQSLVYLRQGVYPRSKKELLPLLSGVERDLLALGMAPTRLRAQAEREAEPLLGLLIRWSAEVLVGLGPADGKHP